MKLYSIPLSPFAARVRLSIYRKGLDHIEILPPPAEGGLKGPQFLSLNPIGRVPTLVLDSGEAIPESATILEYLEDVYPEPSLRPKSAEHLARARLFLRLPDIYFENSPRILLGMRNPADRKEDAVETAFAALHRGLSYMNHFIDPAPWAVGGQPSIADCAVVPVLNVVNRVAAVYEQPDLIDSYGNLRAYWAKARFDHINERVINEQLAAAPK